MAIGLAVIGLFPIAEHLLRVEETPVGFVVHPLNGSEGASDALFPPCPLENQTLLAQEQDFCTQLIDNAGVASTHAAALALLPNGDIGAYWYGGTREGAKDVEIYSARYSHETGEFSNTRPIIGREMLSEQLGRYIKKVGNMAAVLDSSNRLWLFFVSISVGGWAGSSLNYMVSSDGGETWSEAKRLVTSPFFNISTLVRATALEMTNGDLMIPVYHEFIGKFSELLIVDENGQVRGKRRISSGRHAIQPYVTPMSNDRAAIFMRSSSMEEPLVQFTVTDDAGQSFDPVRSTELLSLGNPVAATPLGDGRIWLLFNNDLGRRVLSIALINADGSGAQPIVDLENGLADPNRRIFAYPTVVTSRDGLHHAAWTYDRKHIKHAVFTDGWLHEQINQVGTNP